MNVEIEAYILDGVRDIRDGGENGGERRIIYRQVDLKGTLVDPVTGKLNVDGIPFGRVPGKITDKKIIQP